MANRRGSISGRVEAGSPAGKTTAAASSRRAGSLAERSDGTTVSISKLWALASASRRNPSVVPIQSSFRRPVPI